MRGVRLRAAGSRLSLAHPACIGSLLLLIGASVAAGQPATSLASGTGNPVLRYLEKLASGKVHAAGVVVSEQGEPLSGVKVIVEKSYFDPTRSDFIRTTSGEEVVNGSFSFRCFTCLGITLYFMKDGYYEERLDLSSVEGLESKNAHETNLTVTLLARGRMGGMWRLESTVATTNVDTLVVMEIPAKLVTSYATGRARLANGLLFRRLGDKGQIDSVPMGGNVFFLAPETGAGKQFDFVRPVLPSGLLSERNWDPCNVFLHAGAEGDGFVPFVPRRANDERLGLREMRTAPEVGYASRIELRSDAPYTFFYCKVRGLYGKGHARRPSSHDPSPRADAKTIVTIFLSLDGTRNVQGEI